MKFLASVFCGMIISIMLILLLGLALKCDHNSIIEVYSFQPENSTASGYTKSSCEKCSQRFNMTLFRDDPKDEKYIDVIEEHCKDKVFVKGEYDTITATVTVPDCDALKTKISCCVLKDNVKVLFSVTFKGEYEEAVSSLQLGDEITFYGKSALKGLSWKDCELITE